MKLQNFKKKTEKFLILNKTILRQLEPNEASLNGNIKYWIKSGELIMLKKGFYALKDFYEKEPQKDLYLEYIANQLIAPSYLSMEYVLSKYQIMPEPVNAITSVTLKTTRELINPLGAFRYYSLSSSLFQGYKIKYFLNSPIWEAEKSKALFDFLYIRFLKNNFVSRQTIEDLRLNWENVSSKELLKASSYVSFVKSVKIRDVFDIIKNLYYA